MDRGWHPAASSGPERPRLGQQPYDRGRGMPYDRKYCYECGQDGHIRRNCPTFDCRYNDSGRMDRSITGGDRRWGHDSWASSRIALPGGRDYGNSRTDSVRESGSSRHTHFDYHDNGDVGNQRPRDTGDRHRDNEVRVHGVVSGQRKDGQETTLREAILSASGQRRDGQETTLKEAILSASGQRRDGQESVAKEPILSSGGQKKDGPASMAKEPILSPLVQRKDRQESVAKEPILSSSHQRKDGPESVAKERILSSSGQRKDGPESLAKETILSSSGQRKDRQESVAKEPILSSFFQRKDGPESMAKEPILYSSGQRKDGQESFAKETILSSSGQRKDRQESVTKEPIPSSSFQRKDGPERLAKEPILSSSGQRKDGQESLAKETILSSSGQRKDRQESVAKEPILSSSGQRKDGPESMAKEPILSSSGQRKDGQESVVKEPILSSSGQRKDGPESFAKETILSSSGQRKDRQESVAKEPILSSSYQRKDGPESMAKEPILSSSGQRKDGPESNAKKTIVSSSGHRKDGPDSIAKDHIVFSSERTDGQESLVKEPFLSLPGQRNDEPEKIAKEAILSSSGQRKDGQESAVKEPVLSSSGHGKDGQESVVEGNGDIKLDCPSPRLDGKCTASGKDSEVSNSPDHGRKGEIDCTNAKDSVEEKVLCELSKQPDVHIVSGLDDIRGKASGIDGSAKRVSGWGVRGDNAQARDSEKRLHPSRRDSKDPVADAAEVLDGVRSSALAEQDPKIKLTGTGSCLEDTHREAAKSTSNSERIRYLKHSEDSTSGRVSSQRSSRELDVEPEWHRRHMEEEYHLRESESYFRRGGNESDPNSMGIEGASASARDSYRERTENLTHSRSGTPGRGRHHSRERDNSMDRHMGWSSREGSVDRNWDRNGYTRKGRTGLKSEYWLHGCADGFDRTGNAGGHLRDDGGEHHGWRHSRIWEAPPGHCQYRPGSYLVVCNARYHRLRRGSLSPSRHNPIFLDSVSPSRHFEEGYNNASQSQGKGWMHQHSQGPLQGPVALTQMEESVSVKQLSEGLLQQEGIEDRVTLAHARSPRNPSMASKPPESQQQSVIKSPMLSEESILPSAPFGQELRPRDHGKVENSDRDICPPGTEAHNAASLDEEDEDFHIDERVDKLMEGRTLIPGREKDIVHEALSIASKRVRQEYESDIVVEESPRSHGGFADIGDQWKDGDFGSEVQGLEGFGFDQQVTKVDAKSEEIRVGDASEGGTVVASAAPEPTPRASIVPYHLESKQESWKWPSRGGDWRLVTDNSHHTKVETSHHRKVVMNGGHPLCWSKSKNLRDPRKQNQESWRTTVAEPMRLQLPKFALKPVLHKADSFAEDYNVTLTQHSVMLLKGAVTPKSQGSTPRAHQSTPVKDRSVGVVAGFQVNKSAEGSSTQGLPSGTGTKSLGQAKHFRASLKNESTCSVKNNSVVDKRGPLRLVASGADGQVKSSSDHPVDIFYQTSKPSLPDGSRKTPSRNSDLQGSDLEFAKSANATPLKKLFISRSMPKEELDSDGNEFVTKPNKNGILVAGKERLEKWSEAKDSSVVTSLGVPVSPALSILTPAALNSAPSTMSHLSVTEESLDTPRHKKRLLDHSMEQASSTVFETPRDNCPKMMEVEVCDGRDGPFGDVGSFRLKRKGLSVEDGEPCKQRQKSSHKKRTLGKEDSESDGKRAHSSPLTHVNSSMSPLVEGQAKASEVNRLEGQDQVEHKAQEQNWAALKPSILCSVFRSLRGDLKTLVNAMATCKSWLAVGERYKTQLKIADLSSVHGQSLDAVLESLPGFGAGKLRSVNLKGCNVSPESVRHLLMACPSISAVDIRPIELIQELRDSFPNVRWVGYDGQSPKDALTRKREAKHLKTRSLKVIGVSRHRLRESEMHPVSDGASKARSPNGYTCVVSTVEETDINESFQDSAVTHSSDGVKLLKLNNGGAIVKSNGVNGSIKAVKQENGNSVSRLPQLKRKTPSGSLLRKLDKASYRMFKPVTGGQRLLSDKHSSTSVKVEHPPRSTISSLFEGDKTLEKEMRLILRVMMEADSNKCFQPPHIVATDGNGATSVQAKALDLLVIEKKLKYGAYAGGKDGFKAFKEDVNLLTRTAFRNDKDKLSYSAAEKIFKLAHQQFKLVESQIAGTSPTDSHNQGKLLGSRPSSKVGKGGLKTHSMLQQHTKKKRKVWDDGVQKVKFGVAKKGRQGESSSGDVDSDSDSTEHETRKVSKLKKEQSWESEVDSSEEDEEPTLMEEDEEETETEASDSDVPSESEGEDGIFEDEMYYSDDDMQLGIHSWGARMTKAAMVPPVTRKYALIDEYKIVVDRDRVEQKMKVQLPEDYEEKLQVAKDQRVDSYSHLDIPETRDYRPRKELGQEVQEQEVYGIDPFTHNLLWDSMKGINGLSDSLRQQFIEERLLLALNKEAKQFNQSGKAPMEYSLERVVERIVMEAGADNAWALKDFSEQLLSNMRFRKEKFVAYRKGLGVVCNKDDGLEKDEFVVEFFGEVYPPWRWYEKQDGIRSLQKKDKDTTPEFYNIFYERPKGDAAGYDLLVVDAMHKANFASRLCHSCRPNCEAKITAVNDKYIIGVYTLKPIQRGEELTFDYNSVTESKEEYNNAVCLCGSQGCRGSYLNLTGSGTFEEVILKQHGLLDRHRLLLDSCTATSVTEEGVKEMRQAGLGSCLLSGLPPWVLKYAAGVVHFMNIEKTLLPAELLKDLELKVQQGMIEGCIEENAEITTEGVYNQRLQNLAITLDKVRHILTKVYKNPSLAPPPLRMLDKKDMVQWIWTRDDSVVNELLQCLAPHLPKESMADFTQSIAKHTPHDLGTNLMQCLLWLRDELRRLPATCKARHDAAADLIHIYAYTRNFFIAEDYAVVESTPMHIHPLDLGSSRHSISGSRLWHKTYSKEYVWGQLIGWYKQSVADPGASLAKAARGCLTLPDVSSCYAKSMQHDFRQGYGEKHRQKMISHMEEKPQQKWPTSKFWSQFWSFKNERGLFGSPMLDAVLEDKPQDDQMLQWLKSREVVFVGPWDEQ